MKRYILTRNEATGEWRCTDTFNGVSCIFEEEKFDETQRFEISNPTELAKSEDAGSIAGIANGIHEHLRANHLFIVTPYTDEGMRTYIANAIVARRKSLGMSQSDLADACGLQQTHISRIERGRYATTIDVIGKVANALGCNVILRPKEEVI